MDKKFLNKLISWVTLVTFMFTSVSLGFAQTTLSMPVPGAMLHLSAKYEPALMVGVQLDAKDPFRFNFLIERGQQELSMDAKREEYRKLVKYFLASLTIPNDDMWVNLSPYEQERIIPDNFGLTEMGRDLLAQDYLLKQITASLIHPDEGEGKNFWKKVYEKAYEKYGTTDIPLDTFNKVWIVPDTATIYHKYDTALIVENHLKVMMEQDYFALAKNQGVVVPVASYERPNSETADLAAEVVREIVIPLLEKEVNGGEHFAPLRQVYSAMLMATWFKKSLNESLLGQVYVDKNKMAGVDLADPNVKEEIYQKYLQAYKTGVFNFIKEDLDAFTQEVIPRKYFSGGTKAYDLGNVKEVGSARELTVGQRDHAERAQENGIDKVAVDLAVTGISPDASQTPLDDPKSIFHAIAPLQFWRIQQILDKGLLSANTQAVFDVQTVRNGHGGYNGRDRISFSASPNLKATGGFGSFSAYTKKGVSFIVQTNRTIIDGSAESGFVDEVFVQDQISPDEIVGISVPEEFKEKKINELSFGLENLGLGSLEEFVLEAAKNIENETGVKVDPDRLEGLLINFRRVYTEGTRNWQEIEDIKQELNALLVDVLAKGLEQKYGITTFQEYFDHYIGDKKPVYDLSKDHVWAYSPDAFDALEGIGDTLDGFIGLPSIKISAVPMPLTDPLDWEVKSEKSSFLDLFPRLGMAFHSTVFPVMTAPMYTFMDGSDDPQRPWVEMKYQDGSVHKLWLNENGRIEGEISDQGAVKVMFFWDVGVDIDGIEEAARAEAGDSKFGSILKQFFPEKKVIAPEQVEGIISKSLSDGKIVFMGDNHAESSHQEFFAQTVKERADEGIKFTVALEIPDFIGDLINGGASIEDIIKQLNENSTRNNKGQKTMHSHAVFLKQTLLPLIRQYQLPVVALDDGSREALGAGVNQRMATRLSSINGPVLGMIGSMHLVKDAIPVYITTPMITMNMAMDINKLHWNEFDYLISLNRAENVSKKSATQPFGGIDLDAGLLNMKIRRDGAGMPLSLPMQDPSLMHIEGLSPTILDITPANALPIFTELKGETAGQVM